jgi:hypothetical protein
VQDAHGATLEYLLDAMTIDAVSFDVPHIISTIDGFIQRRSFDDFHNYAGPHLIVCANAQMYKYESKYVCMYV